MASLPALEICEAAQDVVYDQVDIQQWPIDPHSYDEHPEISLHALAGVTTQQPIVGQVFLQEYFS